MALPSIGHILIADCVPPSVETGGSEGQGGQPQGKPSSLQCSQTFTPLIVRAILHGKDGHLRLPTGTQAQREEGNNGAIYVPALYKELTAHLYVDGATEPSR